MTPAGAAAALAVAYVLGSIPFALIAGRLVKGIDLRDVGSGNLGATNAFRTLGVGPGIAVLVADAAKGAAAVAVAKALAGGAGALAGTAASSGADATLALLVPILCAPAAMAGHTWTVFAGFKGGKGVAAGAGAFLALAPGPTGAAVAVWAILFAASGYVSVGSMGAAVSFPIAVFTMTRGPDRSYLLAASLAAAVLILLRHVPNMRRLAAGTENRALWKARGGR